jgi:heat shock protein HslJ
MMRRALLTLALVPALLIAGCNMLGGAAGTGGPIEGTRWLLTSYRADGASVAVPAGAVVDATFAGGIVSGSTGCNSYNGPATIDGSKITIGELVSTLMMCVGPAADVEPVYIAALPTATSFTASADKLTLFDGSGAAILEYAAGPANPLIGAWTVTGFNNGNQAVVSPEAGTEMTAEFGEDGTLTGSGGCNTYNGSWTLTDATLAIGPLASTKMACEEAVMTQETQFLTALGGATGYRVEGANITLTSADGSNAVTLAPAS